MESTKILNEWLDWKDKANKSRYTNTKSFLTQEAHTIKDMVAEGKYWEAYNELNLSLLYCSHLTDQGHSKAAAGAPVIVLALLEWFSENKPLIGKIVKGIGGESYKISNSLSGMKLSVSFSS